MAINTPKWLLALCVRIKKKLIEGNAMITKADKGSSVIVMYSPEYNNKIDNFIDSNNFACLTTDITRKLQRDIRNTVNDCHSVIPKDDKWRYINLCPTLPTIRGLVNIHKVTAPIRPVINWKNAPAYKFAKMLAKKLKTYIPLPYAFNVKNTTQLINDLKDISYNHNLRLASFDIKNMYTNISTSKLTSIIEKDCQDNHIDYKIKLDIIKLSNTVNNQNCFQFHGDTYIQMEGLAMGAPTSSVLSEFYLQHLETTNIYNALLEHNIVG